MIIVLILTTNTCLGYDKIWTSGKRPDEGGRYEFYWTNSGDPFRYTNWAAGQPYKYTNTSDCVALLSTKDGCIWDDISCVNQHITAICEW